jgi:hypothetical protein
MLDLEVQQLAERRDLNRAMQLALVELQAKDRQVAMR